MTNTNDFSKKDMEDIITDIDSKKEGFSISGAREEVMLDRFALPFYKFIDNAVFENTKKKSNANYGYGYGSNNYNYSAYLNFILKNKDIFDFTWSTFNMGNKISLIERFIFVYKNYFNVAIKGSLYVGSTSKDEPSSIALSYIIKNCQTEIGETPLQIKQFFEAVEKKFPGKDLVNSNCISLELDKIIAYVVNGTFHENINIVELYDLSIKKLEDAKLKSDKDNFYRASIDIEFLKDINSVVFRNHYVIDSEWKRLDKGEGFLERRRKYVHFIMRNGIPTPLMVNDISSQGFDSLKIAYLEEVKHGAVNTEDEDLMLSDIIKVASSAKSLDNIGQDGATSLKFLLNKKSSIAIPLLSSAQGNKICKDLLKQHFEKLK